PSAETEERERERERGEAVSLAASSSSSSLAALRLPPLEEGESSRVSRAAPAPGGGRPSSVAAVE
uniref:Uncharacterized protein n=1 Tax=Oryza nivara TaxID=4536 RepID=A0A0E0I6S5_ORYNI